MQHEKRHSSLGSPDIPDHARPGAGDRRLLEAGRPVAEGTENTPEAQLQSAEAALGTVGRPSPSFMPPPAAPQRAAATLDAHGSSELSDEAHGGLNSVLTNAAASMSTDPRLPSEGHLPQQGDASPRLPSEGHLPLQQGDASFKTSVLTNPAFHHTGSFHTASPRHPQTVLMSEAAGYSKRAEIRSSGGDDNAGLSALAIQANKEGNNDRPLTAASLMDVRLALVDPSATDHAFVDPSFTDHAATGSSGLGHVIPVRRSEDTQSSLASASNLAFAKRSKGVRFTDGGGASGDSGPLPLSLGSIGGAGSLRTFSAGGAASGLANGERLASALSAKLRPPPLQQPAARSSLSGSSSSAALMRRAAEGGGGGRPPPAGVNEPPGEGGDPPQTPMSGIYDPDEGVIKTEAADEDIDDEPRQSGNSEEDVDGSTPLKV